MSTLEPVSTLNPVITQAGLTALINAKEKGFKAKITHVAVGNGDGRAGPSGRSHLRGCPKSGVHFSRGCADFCDSTDDSRLNSIE